MSVHLFCCSESLREQGELPFEEAILGASEEWWVKRVRRGEGAGGVGC